MSFWPTDDGWPYPDSGPDFIDLGADADDDLLNLQTTRLPLLNALDPLERKVITARFGLDGRPSRTIKELHFDTGLTRADLREALGSGLAKLRISLAD